MKTIKIILSVVIASILIEGCDFLDTTNIETRYEESEVFVNYNRLLNAGTGVYPLLTGRFGFNRIGSAMLASACDEADHADKNSSIKLYNDGTWNPASNPEDCWLSLYNGIRTANVFMEQSENYKTVLYRDTLMATNKDQYWYNVRNIEWLRAEARFLRALYHFELIKRYGGVPIMAKSTNDESALVHTKRNSYNECVDFIVKECDAVIPLLKDTWVDFDGNRWRGRATRVSAQALKARTLLYAASPLNNAANDLKKWEDAAKAAADIINPGSYRLHTDYRGLFRLGNGSDGNAEVLFAVQRSAENSFEMNNFPIGYDQGGQATTSPSQNLVNAYNMKTTGMPISEPGSGYDPDNPYSDRDPRLELSIIVNNSIFKNRAVECWAGGLDGLGKPKATTTGYYLKKYVNESLDLAQNQTSIHSWILFRYGEVLLNYAEAMNEAFGPEANNGYAMTARDAVDAVRKRQGINMPELPHGLTKDEMRERIRNERQVELAFEEHRFFDIRRWKIAEQTENSPLMAMQITKKNDGTFEYLAVKCGDRVFKNYMYLYPIPEAEVLKGSVEQNPGW